MYFWVKARKGETQVVCNVIKHAFPTPVAKVHEKDFLRLNITFRTFALFVHASFLHKNEAFHDINNFCCILSWDFFVCNGALRKEVIFPINRHHRLEKEVENDCYCYIRVYKFLA